MSARIGQRAPSDLPIWTLSPVLSRGGTVVDIGSPVWRLPFRDGLGVLATSFTTPATVPVTGAWTIAVPELTPFGVQDIGTIILGEAVYVLHLNNGVFTTTAAFTASQLVTLRGMVTV